MALFSIGLLCPQFEAAQRWRDRGWQIVLRQAEAQVLPDGMHFEQSIYYHVYALDFFVYAKTLAERNAIPIPPAFAHTTAKKISALAADLAGGRAATFRRRRRRPRLILPDPRRSPPRPTPAPWPSHPQVSTP